MLFTKHAEDKFEILKKHKFHMKKMKAKFKQIETKNQTAKFSYEPDADVLTWEISGKPINYAKEVGNIVVHFTKNNMPVLVEILEASQFLTRAKSIATKQRISFPQYIIAAGV